MIGGFSHMFATMFGSAFLSQAVKTGASKMAKAFSKRTFKAMVRVEKAELARRNQSGVTVDIASRAVRNAARQHTSMMKEIRGFRRRANTSIEGAIPKQLNRSMGRLLDNGGMRKSFTGHAKDYAINELTTMPIMYAMYRNDKATYPEMKNENFGSYYASTIPFSLGFMAASSGSKLFQRRIKGNLKNKLKNNPDTVRRSIHTAGMLGNVATKAFSRIANISGEIRRETFRQQPIKDLFSIAGARKFIDRVGRAARVGANKKESYFGTDSGSIHRTIKATTVGMAGDTSAITETLNKNFNSMINRSGKTMEFVNSIIEKEQKIIRPYNRKHKDLIEDRGIWQFENKVYDTRAFHLGKIRDLAAEKLDRMNMGLGSMRLHPYKIITSGVNFLKTDFQKSLDMMLPGGKTNSIASTFFSQMAYQSQKNFTSDMTEEEKLRTYFKDLIKGPNVSPSNVDSFADQFIGSFKKPNEATFKSLNQNYQRGFLGLNEKSLFYVDSTKTGNILLNDGTNLRLHNTSFAFGTTDNKSTIASSISRMLGVTRDRTGKIIAGRDHSRLPTKDELIQERRMHGYSEDNLYTAVDDLLLKNEIGGGGTTSIFSIIGGFFKKFKSPTWSGNMFNSDYSKAVRAGTIENRKYYINNIGNNITKVQDEIFDIMTKKGSNWDEFIDAFDEKSFRVRGSSKKSFSISDMSLNGVSNKDTALEKVSNAIDFAQGQNQGSLVHFLNTVKKKISVEQENNVQTVLSELNPSGLPIGKNYEAILFQTFTSSANNKSGDKILDTVFNTAKRLHGNNSLDFEAPLHLLQVNRKVSVAKRSFKNSEKFINITNDLLDDIIDNNNIYQNAITNTQGKWGIHFQSMHDISSKFVKPTDDTLFLVPEKGGFFPQFTKPDELGNSFVKNSIGTGSHIMLGSMETFNKAMGVLGLGIDNYRSSTEFLGNYLKKRILPMAGGIAGMDVLDRMTDQNPLFNNTPLQDGVYQVGANAYAGLRLASAGLMDSVGITDAAKYFEDLLPGSINSPLSGAVRGGLPPIAGAMLGFSKFGPTGGIMGGVIGSAVSAITAGGPLALFDSWDISKDRAQVLAELKGETLTQVKKGRFWEFSSGHFWGTQTDYFRPHMYALMRSDYKEAPNFKTSFFDEIASYVDPSAYNRRHYFSRPSPESPGMFSNIPIIGGLVGLPSSLEHQDRLNLDQMSSDRYNYRQSVLEVDYMGSHSPGGITQEQKIGRASGLGSSREHINNFYGEPISSSAIESRLSDAFYNLKEVGGLRGFLTETLQNEITGNNQLFADRPRMEANNIGSMNRQFWDLSLGGLGGLSEGIRRIFSRKTSDISYWNPLRNTLPDWMPDDKYYINFQNGDPFSKVQMGEARLPGEGYRALYDVDINPSGEGKLLGTTPDEAIGYYSGNLETLVPRFNAEDQITKYKRNMLNELKGLGSLVKEESISYDIERDITAKSDGTIKLESGEVVPINFAPMVKGRMLAGAASGLNAYLALAGKSKGMLIGIDVDSGQTSEMIIKADIEKYKQEADKDFRIRQEAKMELRRLQESGAPVSEGMAYSHLDKLRILGDVAYYSNNFKTELSIVKKQIAAGILGPEAEAEVEVILDQVDAKKQKFLFTERRFTNQGTALTREGQLKQEAIDQKYSFIEKGVGAAWESLTYMRNPITSRFIGNRDALQAYEEDVVYGQEFKSWSSPIDSFITPYFNKMAQENNPIQGALSGTTAGYIFGGPMGAAISGIAGAAYSATIGQMVHDSGWIPEEVRKQRQIMMAADVAEHQRYKELYDATGYDEFRYRMRNTVTDALNINQPLTVERMAKLANKPDKYYVRQILQNANTSNISEMRRVLSPEIRTMMDRSLGVDMGISPQDMTGGYSVDPKDISNYDRPIEDIVVKTFQREGMDHHKVGLGWNDTLRRMSMEERLKGPISGMATSDMPERNLTAKVNGASIKRQLSMILRSYNAQISLESTNGPVNVIVEVI